MGGKVEHRQSPRSQMVHMSALILLAQMAREQFWGDRKETPSITKMWSYFCCVQIKRERQNFVCQVVPTQEVNLLPVNPRTAFGKKSLKSPAVSCVCSVKYLWASLPCSALESSPLPKCGHTELSLQKENMGLGLFLVINSQAISLQGTGIHLKVRGAILSDMREVSLQSGSIYRLFIKNWQMTAQGFNKWLYFSNKVKQLWQGNISNKY